VIVPESVNNELRSTHSSVKGEVLVLIAVTDACWNYKCVSGSGP
jgi:hypothetical protein